MSCFLGIDVGTSSVKSMIMEPDGTILHIAQRQYDAICPEPNWVEISVKDLWDSTCETLRELTSKYPQRVDEIRAISFSGQMHGMILLDEKDQPLWNAINCLDSRAKEESEEIEGLSVEKGYRGALLNHVTTGFFVCFMYWMKRHHPDVLEKARKAMVIKDYIRYKICGEVGSDYSDAASTLIFDQVKREWLWDMMEDLQLDRELFAKEIHNAHEIAGRVTRACAAETGLREGTLVCYGGGDTLMNHIGNGLVRNDGRILSTIGSSSHVSTGLNIPLSDPKGCGYTYCHALPEKWMMLAGGPNGGIVMKWLKNNVLGRQYSFDEMSKIAATAPAGSNGVMCVPYILGVTYPNDPNAKSVYVGMGMVHGQPELIRSTMEGLVYILRKSLMGLRDLGIDTKTIIATGGGSLDPVLLRIQADMYNLPVYVNAGKEISCMGAAISAAVGSGYYRSYEEACDAIVHFREEWIEPNPQNAAIYAENAEKFDLIYMQNRQFF